jgi:tRNA (guanine-N7-)-methyltransferase
VASAPRYDNPPRLPEGEGLDPRTLFFTEAATRPLELEIGPGRGSFILERASLREDLCLLGLEIRRKWACIVDERLRERGLHGRARVLCEDARLALPRLGPDASIARAFLHFPDPWWKKRHEKRLVIVDPVIDQLGRLLCDGGELFVQTDVAERADAYEERLSRHPDLAPAGDSAASPRLAESPYRPARSNREKHSERDGLPVWRLRYRRVTRSGS